MLNFLLERLLSLLFYFYSWDNLSLCFCHLLVQYFFKLYGYLYILRAGIIKLKPGDMIKNISRTSKCRRSGSWNSFKAKNTGNRPADKCQVFRCTDKDTVGSHVKKKGSGDKPYIVNLCRRHNSHHNNEWMRVTSGTPAVLVRKRDTRGPKQCYKWPN